jgi:triosephosphate isomerase
VRKPVLAANWKMHKTVAESVAFARAFGPLVANTTGAEIVVAPPFTALAAVAGELAGSNVKLAAQNVHPALQGAFTGEIAPAMLAELGCAYAIVGHSERRALFGESSAFVAKKAAALLAGGLLPIVGHSERRALFGESSAFVAKKAAALLAGGLLPIVCVGETLAEREAGRTFAVLEDQLTGSLTEIPGDRAAEIVLAYEPVWAIGTGKTATPTIAQEAHAMIRGWLAKHFGAASGAIRIQYGGSVKPENTAELMAQPDIDGALVGGASLDPASFARIVNYQESPK